MTWQAFVVARVLLTHVLNQFVVKYVAGLPNRERNFAVMFAASVVFTLVMALLTNTPLADSRLLVVALVGFFNAFGAYAYWRAVDINMTRTALFMQGDDLIGVCLGLILLGEH